MKKFIVFLLVLAIIGAGAYYFLFRETSSDEASKLYEELRFISEGDLQDKNTCTLIDGQVYLSFDYIKENLDPEIFFDENEKTVIITSKTQVKRFGVDKTDGTVNDVSVSLRDPIQYVDDVLMIPIEIFIYDYPVDLKYIEDKNLVILDRKDTEYLTAKVTVSSAMLREDENSESPIVKELKTDDQLIVYGETKDWYKVREIEGYAGYVKKSHVELSHEFKNFTKKVEINSENENGEKLNLVWDYTNRKTQNADKVNNLVGVNIVSPTWFSITDKNFQIDDRSNWDYINTYASMGKEMWPMLDNSFDSGLTHAAISKSSTRQKIIQDTLKKYKYWHFQGINIDFENINTEDRDLYTQFVRELYPIFHNEGLTVSVDVTPRASADLEKEKYDRKRLADICDYVMLMAYDQHWATSPKAGSVAEYKWVESNMNVLFRSIPREKMVLGIPLYNRVWFEDQNGKVTSQSVSMEAANKLIQENNMELEWDSVARQNYGSKTIDGKTVSIWQEDANSIREKVSLVTKYNLAGVAAWRKDFETEDIWDVINENLK